MLPNQAMKSSEIIWLTGSIVLGIVLLSLQTLLFNDPTLLGIITDADPTAWQAILPSFTSIIIFSALATTLWWIYRADTFKKDRCSDALSRKLPWKLKGAGLYVFLILVLTGYYLYNQESVPINLFIAFAILILPLDIAILYWLPTAIATPRTLRRIPTGSTTLRNLIGD